MIQDYIVKTLMLLNITTTSFVHQTGYILIGA